MAFSLFYPDFYTDIDTSSLFNNQVYTMTTTDYIDYGEREHIKYFNCKRCGAVGQHGVCEYCGSAE